MRREAGCAPVRAFPQVPEGWRTGRVVQELVKGLTQTHQCRFVDMMPPR
jgi:hypothetical protein